MSITTQIMVGSLLLGLCSIIHIVILAYAIKFLTNLDKAFRSQGSTAHWIVFAAAGFGIVVFAHTVQVWTWAIAFVALDALPQISNAIYFALVTYTTLGYGDVTLDAGFRVFAAMAAVTGLLNFGLSTAFLVALVSRLLPRF
ncbi:MAG: ion channel [Hyphomicrobiaceae bacterium]